MYQFSVAKKTVCTDKKRKRVVGSGLHVDERPDELGQKRLAMAIAGPAVAMAEEWVYRVCPQEEWASAQVAGVLQGGALDTSSGFIHLSTAAQVVGTLSRFYAGRDDLYLLKINAAKLGDGLHYDNVEGLGEFPHFYGPNGTFCPLPLSAVEASAKVKLESGKHILPFVSTDS